MKLLVYGLNYAPEKTGTGKYTAEMAEWFASRGHQVEAIVSPPHYPEWELHDGFSNKHGVELRNNVHVRRVPMYVPSGEITAKKRIRMESSYSFHSLRPWLKKLFSREKPDAIIAVCPPMQIGLLPFFYSKIRRVPWTYHIQDLQVDAAVRLGILQSKLARVLFQIEQFLLCKATLVTTITLGMERRIREKGAARVFQVQNWAGIDHIQPGPTENAFRKRLGIPVDQTLVMYSGNLGKKQGLDILLESAALVSNPTIHFVIIGDGVERAGLEQKAMKMKLENVHFLPLQPWADVPDMLRAADFHVLPQKAEAADLVMPSKLTNILAAGRPVVATANQGTALFDVVNEFETGFLCEPDNPIQLAKTMEQMAASPNLSKMRENARNFAEKNLAIDEILGRFEKKLLQVSK